MKWLAGLIVGGIATWAQSISNRAYVKGYEDGIENVERAYRLIDKRSIQSRVWR